MTDWEAIFAWAFAATALSVLYGIFQEVRSIRRMMNDAHPDFQDDETDD